MKAKLLSILILRPISVCIKSFSAHALTDILAVTCVALLITHWFLCGKLMKPVETVVTVGKHSSPALLLILS